MTACCERQQSSLPNKLVLRDCPVARRFISEPWIYDLAEEVYDNRPFLCLGLNPSWSFMRRCLYVCSITPVS